MQPETIFTIFFSGEHMKKYLLSAALLFASATIIAEEPAPTEEHIENALDMIASNYHTSFLALPAWAKVRVVGFGTLGAACVWLSTRAFTNIFKPYAGKDANGIPIRRDLDITDWESWTWAETGTTPLSLIWFCKALSESEKPEGVAKTANEDGLLHAILACKTTEELTDTVDRRFVTERFPRAIAFNKLTSLREALNKLFGLLKETQYKKPSRHFAVINRTLITNLNHVDNVLLLLKSDPRWFDECNAHTLKQAQGVQEANHNAQLAGTAVHLAHAYSR
jgi:hypothetical protein